MTIRVVTKIIPDPRRLPAGAQMFSDIFTARSYAITHCKVIYYVRSNQTFYVEAAQ